MAKVLVIRKTDKTIHVVPLENKAVLQAFSNRSKLGWKFEEMEEEEAKDLPFIDKDYVTAAEAQNIVKSLEVANKEKDDEIDELRKKLAALQGGGSENAGSGSSGTAKELIEKINAATTAEKVTTLLGSDERVTVKDAADKKLAALQG